MAMGDDWKLRKMMSLEIEFYNYLGSKLELGTNLDDGTEWMDVESKLAAEP